MPYFVGVKAFKTTRSNIRRDLRMIADRRVQWVEVPFSLDTIRSCVHELRCSGDARATSAGAAGGGDSLFERSWPAARHWPLYPWRNQHTRHTHPRHE